MFAAAASAPSLPPPASAAGDQSRALAGLIADVRRMRAGAAEAGLGFARDRLAGLADAASKLLLIGRGQVAFGGVKSLMNSAVATMDALRDAAPALAGGGRLREMVGEFESLGARLAALARAAARTEDEKKEAGGFQVRLRESLARLRDAAG